MSAPVASSALGGDVLLVWDMATCLGFSLWGADQYQGTDGGGFGGGVVNCRTRVVDWGPASRERLG